MVFFYKEGSDVVLRRPVVRREKGYLYVVTGTAGARV
jgi:hypothetical protein